MWTLPVHSEIDVVTDEYCMSPKELFESNSEFHENINSTSFPSKAHVEKLDEDAKFVSKYQ